MQLRSGQPRAMSPRAKIRCSGAAGVEDGEMVGWLVDSLGPPSMSDKKIRESYNCHSYGKSPFLSWENSRWIVIFNSYVSQYQRVESLNCPILSVHRIRRLWLRHSITIRLSLWLRRTPPLRQWLGKTKEATSFLMLCLCICIDMDETWVADQSLLLVCYGVTTLFEADMISPC